MCIRKIVHFHVYRYLNISVRFLEISKAILDFHESLLICQCTVGYFDFFRKPSCVFAGGIAELRVPQLDLQSLPALWRNIHTMCYQPSLINVS